ncbi:GvpL/GvpF family gas vesicle protein [Rhodococcus phenolicus]|uniref:GvpL/GvpF family gas vesicle protein n=1 Tax=Rhodococcus phenolicus TaxID=263849 RepID=UPI00082C38D1|nr:GvpL/GvpF family gas vesicle protein [Rhodococcus phenolicus]
MTADHGVWVYAVTGAGLPEDAGHDVAGVARETIRTVTAAGLTAVVGTVPLGEFGEEALRSNLENLDWLETVARAHDGVVSAVVRRAPAIPLRLATVYRDDDRVRDVLDARRADFEEALALVTGRTEWGVKAYADLDAIAASAVEAAGSGAEKGTGTAYLLRRRAQLSARDEAERVATGDADALHSLLLRCAAAGRRQAPTDPTISGRRDRMVLNGTYLVDDDRRDEFAEAVAAARTRFDGLHLELTGPWPPYSFAGADRGNP